MPGAIGSHDAVVTEVGIRRVVVVAVASIDADGASVQLVVDTLIHPVPDEAALCTWLFANLVPVFLEPAHRIAHRMCIFRLDDGAWIVAVEVTFHIVGVVVLGAKDVGVVLQNRAFILYEARGVFLFQPVIDGHEIHAITCFVAHTPDDD